VALTAGRPDRRRARPVAARLITGTVIDGRKPMSTTEYLVTTALTMLVAAALTAAAWVALWPWLVDALADAWMAAPR
jgi:hypothetical protein